MLSIVDHSASTEHSNDEDGVDGVMQEGEMHGKQDTTLTPATHRASGVEVGKCHEDHQSDLTSSSSTAFLHVTCIHDINHNYTD